MDYEMWKILRNLFHDISDFYGDVESINYYLDTHIYPIIYCGDDGEEYSKRWCNEVVPPNNDNVVQLANKPQSKQTKTFTLKETNFFTRHPCHLCGGTTEKVAILCEAEDGMRICESCLKERDFDGQMIRLAERYESMATELRALVGKIEAPIFGEWEKAYEEHERRWREQNPQTAQELDEIEALDGTPF